VLAVGGFREKALAAHRHGLRRLIAPKENARDLLKLSPTVRRELEIIFASNMDQVIAAAIRLDENLVGGLLEGIEPAAAAVAPESLAAVPSESDNSRRDELEADA
jgi:predicted ATP-dependent protease